MTPTTGGSEPLRALPARANLDYLKTEAKRRLDALRPQQPALKLTEVQFRLARELGFASWRALKAEIDSRSASGAAARGDWIGRLPQDTRVALHIAADGVTMDSPDYGSFGFRVQDFAVDDEHLSFALLRINAGFEGRWDAGTGTWQGTWRQDGMAHRLTFERGVFPPAPVIDGLDGLWEGMLTDQRVRLVLRVTTDRHGTFAHCDSPDRSGYDFPAQSIVRDGEAITVVFKTARLDGRLTAAGDRIDASFGRDGKAWPVVLTRRAPGDAPLSLPRVDLTVDELAIYAGHYVFTANGKPVTISLAEACLSAHFPDGTTVEMIAHGDHEFTFRQGVGRLIFDCGLDGRVSGLTFRLRDRDSPARRVT